jgi:hypothetical protein
MENNIIIWQDDTNDELLPLMDSPDTFFSKTHVNFHQKL